MRRGYEGRCVRAPMVVGGCAALMRAAILGKRAKLWMTRASCERGRQHTEGRRYECAAPTLQHGQDRLIAQRKVAAHDPRLPRHARRADTPGWRTQTARHRTARRAADRASSTTSRPSEPTASAPAHATRGDPRCPLRPATPPRTRPGHRPRAATRQAGRPCDRHVPTSARSTRADALTAAPGPADATTRAVLAVQTGLRVSSQGLRAATSATTGPHVRAERWKNRITPRPRPPRPSRDWPPNEPAAPTSPPQPPAAAAHPRPRPPDTKYTTRRPTRPTRTRASTPHTPDTPQRATRTQGDTTARGARTGDTTRHPRHKERARTNHPRHAGRQGDTRQAKKGKKKE